LICRICATAADRRAPRDQHCTDPKCTCGHRVQRYRFAPGGILRNVPAIDEVASGCFPRPGAPEGLYGPMHAAVRRTLTHPLPPMARHPADDENPDDEPFNLGPVLAIYERLAAETDAHTVAVEAAIARLEAEPGDRTITFPRITTED
jgi:hypothetical protein